MPTGRPTVIGSNVDRTPAERYSATVLRARATAVARDITQQQFDTLDTATIYCCIFDGDILVVRKVDIIKITPKRYRVRYISHDYTIPRVLIDTGKIVRSSGDRFARGSTVQSMLYHQLIELTAAVEQCAREADAARHALLA